MSEGLISLIGINPLSLAKLVAMLRNVTTKKTDIASGSQVFAESCTVANRIEAGYIFTCLLRAITRFFFRVVFATMWTLVIRKSEAFPVFAIVVRPGSQVLFLDQL